MYDLEKVETLKYLDLSKSKWRSVEARIKNNALDDRPHD